MAKKKTRQELQRERQAEIAKRKAALVRKITFLQNTLYLSLAEIITGFDIEDDGTIKNTVKNYQQAKKVNVAFSSFAKRSKNVIVRTITSGVRRILGLNKAYFKTMKEFSADTIEKRALRLTMEQLGFDPVKKTVLKDSWLEGLTTASNVKTTVMSRINTAISGGQTLEEFRSKFKSEFTDSKKGLGLLQRHYNTHTANFYSSVDRQTQLFYAQKIGLEHAVYAGTRKNNTRDFCLERVNNVYTINEIKRWEGLSWKGKIEDSDVLVTLGGHNCRHTLNFVTPEIAEAIAKRRGGMDNFNTI